MLFVALHFRKLKNKMLIMQGFEKAKWLEIGCKYQTREDIDTILQECQSYIGLNISAKIVFSYLPI
jgi:hypothetical protein